MTGEMTIGQLATRADSAIETIRFYERVGIFPPPGRSKGNYRLYGETHLQRLVFIGHCRLLDLSLDEIRVLLELRDAPEKSCSEVNAVLDQHLIDVGRRITQLGKLQTQLKNLRARCRPARAVKDCRILDELSRGAQTVTSRGRGAEVDTKPVRSRSATRRSAAG
jgi:Cd(II)/Pb(II)-responsive transcriptional regulator